ncbi:MAG: hypothetical protein WBK78_08600 [Syntrophomonadaceae bacterium]
MAAIICALFIGYRFAENHYPDKSTIQTIIPGLSHSNVVQRLGVMYDSAKPGEYTDMDKVLSGMQNNESISRLCVWRIRSSRDLFWVGLDDSDTVISVRIEER